MDRLLTRFSVLRAHDPAKMGGEELKEWKCVLVGHHDNVGKVIEEWEKAGWRLHTYACAGNAAVALGTNHYLLFEKGT